MVTPDQMKEIAFLRNLDEQYIGQVAALARIEECKAETVLFRQGQNCAFIYFILSGEFELLEESGGNSVEIARIGSGELLGWSPILGNNAMTATARAVASAQLLVLDVKSVLDLSEKDPKFGLAFLREIARVVSERLWGARRNLARLKRHRPLLGVNPEGSD